MEGAKIITISREFGSGGRTIARALAEKMGIPYYDKELIKQVAEKTGFDPKYIEETGEYSQSKSILSYVFASADAVGSGNGLSAADFLWVMQRQVILDLAQKGPCVILGRCADFILREREDCFHAFIYADKALRAERIVKLYGESDASPQRRLEDKDGRRRVNYKHYTGREWGKCQNYNLCLDSGKIGIDQCADVIAEICGRA